MVYVGIQGDVGRAAGPLLDPPLELVLVADHLDVRVEHGLRVARVFPPVVGVGHHAEPVKRPFPVLPRMSRGQPSLDRLDSRRIVDLYRRVQVRAHALVLARSRRVRQRPQEPLRIRLQQGQHRPDPVLRKQDVAVRHDRDRNPLVPRHDQAQVPRPGQVPVVLREPEDRQAVRREVEPPLRVPLRAPVVDQEHLRQRVLQGRLRRQPRVLELVVRRDDVRVPETPRRVRPRADPGFPWR